jgi:imidazolonepropionase-like amidohydrolase
VRSETRAPLRAVTLNAAALLQSNEVGEIAAGRAGRPAS